MPHEDNIRLAPPPADRAQALFRPHRRVIPAVTNTTYVPTFNRSSDLRIVPTDVHLKINAPGTPKCGCHKDYCPGQCLGNNEVTLFTKLKKFAVEHNSPWNWNVVETTLSIYCPPMGHTNRRFLHCTYMLCRMYGTVGL